MKKSRSIYWKYYDPQFEFIKSIPPENSPWWGHSFFAYDLISNVQPKIVVELGTYKGNSLFSFAQAIKDSNLNTKLHCVDSWEGDKHAGFYGDEVYQGFLKIYEKKYKNIPLEIHRMFFDDAVDKFKDHSINVLHIDGLHTYEAVKHDFETWLPKVDKTSGIILLHDVCEKKDDFGVYKLWAEIQKKYKTFTFNHYHGLGVIILGKNSLLEKAISGGLFVKYYDVLATEQLLQKTTKEQEKHIRLLRDENRARYEALISLDEKYSKISDEIESYRNEINEYRAFKKSKIWAGLSRWRKYKSKIKSIISRI